MSSVRVTQRAGNTYVTTGVGIWFLTLILLAALALYLILFLILFVGILLILRWVMRRWTWTEYVGGVVALVFVFGTVGELVVNLVRMYGWTGVWTATVFLFLLMVGIGLFLLYSYDQAAEEGWLPAAPPPTHPPTTQPPLSASEQIRLGIRDDE